MAYSGIGFVNNNPPAINAENLNKMDNELVKLDKDSETLKNEVDYIEKSVFDTGYIAYNKSSSIFTKEQNTYANQYGKVTLSGYLLCYFEAKKDTKIYFSDDTISSGATIYCYIYDRSITAENYIKGYRSSNNDLPSSSNKCSVSAGNIVTVSVYTPSTNPNDFSLLTNHFNTKLSNGVVLNTNQINQIKEDIVDTVDPYSGTYHKLEKTSSVFTVENNTYANQTGKVTLSGYTLYYFVANKNFDCYFDAATLAENYALLCYVYNNGEISGTNYAYGSRRDGNPNPLPTISSKLSISAGQVLAISMYGDHEFALYANYIEEYIFKDNIVLNNNQIEQVKNALPSDFSGKFTNFAYNKKIAWFGDSISEMRQLPHTVGTLLEATVYDCSFRGTPIGRTYQNYNEFSFSHLVTSIVAGDFSAQWTQLEQMEQEQGQQLPHLRENLTHLENIDFSEIDYCVLLQGTNDFGLPINVQSGSPYSTRLEEMQELMDDAFHRFLTFAPNVKFYIFSPFYRGDKTEDNYHDTLPEYVAAEEEVAAKYAIPFYNLYTNSRICAETKLQYLNSADLVHPNEYGDNYLAEICAKFIAVH